MANNNISVIVPVYYGEKTLDELTRRVFETTQKLELNLELILVNDASPDTSWEIIKELKKKHTFIVGINLSRNFGQHYAISAGLSEAKGDWVVVMDCDLQDVPEEIERLYKKAKEGYDVILAKRKSRKDGFFKKLFSKTFYFFLSYLSGVKYDAQVGNFGIYHNQVIRTINSLPEKNRYFPSMIKWVGFKQTSIEVAHSKREGDGVYFVNSFHLVIIGNHYFCIRYGRALYW